jgi:hypothetical protein
MIVPRGMSHHVLRQVISPIRSSLFCICLTYVFASLCMWLAGGRGGCPRTITFPHGTYGALGVRLGTRSLPLTRLALLLLVIPTPCSSPPISPHPDPSLIIPHPRPPPASHPLCATLACLPQSVSVSQSVKSVSQSVSNKIHNATWKQSPSLGFDDCDAGSLPLRVFEVSKRPGSNLFVDTSAC